VQSKIRTVSRYFYRATLALGLISSSLFTTAMHAHAGDSAVIFMYHRFGEDKYPTTSIRLEQFEAHLAELKSGGYTVKALPDIIKALQGGTALPDKTIALTIDDAYLSVYEKAWPRLKELGLPFTLFVATDPVDQGNQGYMSWSQIRELSQGGVTIGSQTASHLHMATNNSLTNRRELEKSNTRFKKELGARPDLIAYPYGEASQSVEQLARASGFVAGFGQHSGVAAKTPDMFYLPRFALNENYGDIKRFKLAAGALALNIGDLSPSDPLIDTGDDNPPAFGFTINGDAALIKSLDKLACYTSHEGNLGVTSLGGGNNQTRIEIRMKKMLPKGRTRLNCTLPADEGRWYWFGRQFYRKN
jgi:peptidoglycan/xylan/chitin deacetylase (PgdA/CDA1 family)